MGDPMSQRPLGSSASTLSAPLLHSQAACAPFRRQLFPSPLEGSHQGTQGLHSPGSCTALGALKAEGKGRIKLECGEKAGSSWRRRTMKKGIQALVEGDRRELEEAGDCSCAGEPSSVSSALTGMGLLPASPCSSFSFGRALPSSRSGTKALETH